MKLLKNLSLYAMCAFAATTFIACDNTDEPVVPDPEFTLDLPEGCFVTPASGATGELTNATAEFYKGNNALVIEDWAPSAGMAAMMSDDIRITNLEVSEYNGKITFSGSDLITKSMFAGLSVTDVRGEIIGEQVMVKLTVHVAGMGGGEASPYPTTYYGKVDMSDESLEISDDAEEEGDN